jgi:RNA polymerase sigma-70 factor (ECF subfamily)
MPPLPLWIVGPEEVGTFMLGQGAACRGSKLIATSANGLPAYAGYKPDPESGTWLPWSVTLLEVEAADGASAPTITGVHNFLAPFMPNLFSPFGLPERLGDADPVIS